MAFHDRNNLRFNTNQDSGNLFGDTNQNSNQFFGDQSIPGLSNQQGGGGGFGFNFGTANVISAGLSGLGNLAQGYASIKNLKLGRETLNFQKDAFNKNFAESLRAAGNRRIQVNNRIADQNAFKTANSRTDLAKLVV